MSNNFLRVFAIIIGFSIWLIVSGIPLFSVTLTIPLCFYNEGACKLEQAPEIITVVLRGKRSDLRRIDYATLAAHVDAQQCIGPVSYISLTEKNLFLPSSINLVSYSPRTLRIQCAA